MTYLAPQDNFMGAKLFIRIPLIRNQVVLKNKNVWAMCKCIVFMSNPDVILKNESVPTHPFISQQLPILDY